MRVATSAEASPAGELEAIYRAYAPSVARWAARLLGPGGDVEDVVHEVFLVADRRLDGFRGESSVATWLHGITYNVVRDHRRRARIRRWFARPPEEPPARTPEEALNALESVRALYRALDQLPEKYRTVLILHDLEDLTAPEIAALTGTRPATVWVHLHRARTRLRETLEAAR